MTKIVDSKKTSYEKLANTLEQIKTLENLAKEYRIECLEDMTKNGIDKMATSIGTFTIFSTTSWKFSQAVKNAESKLKVLKEKEKETGKAKAEQTQSVKFTSLKD